jgi:hypothetical protein
MFTGRPTFALWLTICVHRVLFLGTTLAVWIGHHRALSAGGYSMRRFFKSAWKRMEFHWQRMRPTVWQSDFHISSVKIVTGQVAATDLVAAAGAR